MEVHCAQRRRFLAETPLRAEGSYGGPGREDSRPRNEDSMVNIRLQITRDSWSREWILVSGSSIQRPQRSGPSKLLRRHGGLPCYKADSEALIRRDTAGCGETPVTSLTQVIFSRRSTSGLTKTIHQNEASVFKSSLKSLAVWI